MPTRKTSKKKKVKPIRPLYGVAIYDAIKRGDSKEMQALAAKARKEVSSVKTALASLDKKVAS